MFVCRREITSYNLKKKEGFLGGIQRKFKLVYCFEGSGRLFQFASCYGGGQQLQIFGRGPRGASYLSLFGYRGPCFAPRPRLVGHNPKMTVRQIIRMLKTMKRVRTREAAAAASR